MSLDLVQKKGNFAEAIYSGCMAYRYALRVELDGEGLDVVFICLNPSTADHDKPDPTVTRCINRCNSMGASSFTMLNIFAYRATDPGDMKKQADPVGHWNDRIIYANALRAGRIVYAWGNHGKFKNRSETVKLLTRNMRDKTYYLKATKTGEFYHPLYVGYKTGFTKL